MKKFLIISILPVPNHIKYCNALQKYFDCEYWFYSDLFGDNYNRPSWWRMDLSEKCRILKNVYFRKSGKCITFDIFNELNRFSPDVIMLGGFSIPSNYFAYVWARWHGTKVIVFTERSRTKKGIIRKKGLLRSLLNFAYRNVDMVMVPTEDTIEQYRDTFGFGDKVVLGNYPIDLEGYSDHEYRQRKPAYTFLFPNRLVDYYDPVLCIEIFRDIANKYPGSKLKMNAFGALSEKCKNLVSSYGLTEMVEFLDSIKSWDDMRNAYKYSDIMLNTASFSSGNISIYESMASGMGIVISDKVMGRTGNFIIDGRNGFKCANNKEEFINRIEKYIANPSFFEEHAKINREIVKPFTTEATAERISSIIHKNLFKS